MNKLMYRALLGHPTKKGDVAYVDVLRFCKEEFPEGFTCYEIHGGYQSNLISGVCIEVLANTVSIYKFKEIIELYNTRFLQKEALITIIYGEVV